MLEGRRRGNHTAEQGWVREGPRAHPTSRNHVAVVEKD